MGIIEKLLENYETLNKSKKWTEIFLNFGLVEYEELSGFGAINELIKKQKYLIQVRWDTKG